MLRCLRPGCPTHCGTRHNPSCADRMLHHALLLLLTIAFLISLAMGLISLSRAAGPSGRVPESAPVAAAETLELLGETQDDGRERILRDCDGKSKLLADASVQIPE